MTEHGMVAMTWSTLFWREYVLLVNNFGVSRQIDEKLSYYAFSLANACAVARSTRRNFCLQAVDVQQFIWCQIARSILYCSIIIVGPSEEAKSQV